MVRRVEVDSDALRVCMTHSMSTESEEVMGLLIGEVEDDISHIYGVILLKRSDKRKDRVEISPEQLSNASTEAEKMGLITRAAKPLRIVGWYHSHPHITVWPSHVDVRTQFMYQMMDKDFVGIIVSCFSHDAAHVGKVQVTCFQTANLSSSNTTSQYERVEVPIQVIPCEEMSTANLKALRNSPQLLLEEETEEYYKSLHYSDQDLLTAVQNATVYSKSVMQTIEIVCTPMIHNLELQLKGKRRTVDQLKETLRLLEERKRNSSSSGVSEINTSMEVVT